MSEPPSSATKTEDSADFSTNLNEDGDATQPTAEILKALDQLNSDTAPNSQESIKLEQPPKEEEIQHPYLSEWESLRNRLRDNPHDPEGWSKLVELAENSGEIAEIKETYESLFEIYPNTSSAQIAYLNHFMIPGSFGTAEAIFKKILLSSPSVDLWRFYLTYVRRVNTKPGARETVQKSYEFALNHVGQDKDSGDIWMEYIQFLKSGETTSTWEEQQKMDALRKVYHRAVQIPIENIERLWSELEAFESNLNKITAKKFMTDLSPSYMQARSVLRQLQRHIGPLFPPAPLSTTSRPTLYLPSLPTFNAAERALVGAWKNYLKWEESNPLELEEKDRPTLIQRVQSVYRKAVIRMRFYGEIWYMSYVWNHSVGKHEDGLNILKEGIRANPTSFLLNFAYAEVLEAKKDAEGVFATFENFTDALRADLEALEARINSANSSFESNGSTKTLPVDIPASSVQTVAATGLTEAGIHSNNSSFNTQSSDEKPPKSKELADKRTEYGLVWIMYMRAARRVESQQSARAIFGRCRKDRWIPWQVYEASALMEYHVCKATNVATRIFEKGIELFGNEEIEIVLRYLGFLISLNDDANARALFERVIVNFSPERARPLWERWARYEYQYGDLESAQKLEKRIAEVYPTDPPIKRFAQRHIYLGTDAIAARDLGFAMARQVGTAGSSSTLGRTDTVQSLLSNSNHQTGASTISQKRPASPDYRKRDDRPPGDYGLAHKRIRPSTPVRDRDRERWDAPGRRRVGSPSWDRDRDRDGPPPPRRMEREREEDKGVVLPPVISWFVGQLPTPSAFDGPVFRTDDLMMVFRNAVIPSTTRARSPPAGPPRGGGRPPPDYGPYQGPGGGRGGRRY